VLGVRALITGGRGFVGNWLSAHLREHGDEVVPIDIETDIADQAALDPVVAGAAPDAVYHLAARTHVGESWEVPAEVLRVNVLGTAAVLAAARRLPTSPTVLVVSSAEVYGSVRPEQLPLTERSPVAPVTPYAASKAAAEQVAMQAWRGYGQRVVVVRPFNHVGPGQAPTFAVAALARRIVEARRTGAGTLAVGTLTTRRDFTDVRDVVKAYRLLIDHGEPGAVYNVCSGHEVAVSDVAARLLALAGCELELVTDLDLVRPVDVPVLRGDPSLLEAATGWKPDIPLEDTLRDVLAYWEDLPVAG
jgi:GDP-4-dehydro-6-deoxy-D-mannose reductase